MEEERITRPDNPEPIQEVAAAVEEAQQFSFDNLKPKIKPIWKVVFMIVLLACIGASLYFSFNALSLDTFEFSETENGWELTGFHNDGTTKEIVIDYVMIKKGVKWEKDFSRPVTSIRQYALCCDNTIEKITVGKNVNSIADQAFYSCEKLKAVFVEEGNGSYLSENGVLYTADKTEIVLFPISYVDYENNIIVHGEGEEREMTYALPATVKKVGSLAFAYAKNLTSVVLPDSVEELGALSFFKCSSLTSLDLPDGLRSIGSDTFSYCKKLTYMFLPASVTKIGHHTFYECSGLNELDVERTEQQFKEINLGDYWKNRTLLEPITIRYGQTRRSA